MIIWINMVGICPCQWWSLGVWHVGLQVSTSLRDCWAVTVNC